MKKIMSNYKFKTTKIKGKEYVEVNERIKFFRQEDKYSGWGIRTEFPVLDSEHCVCLCTITDTNGFIVAQGHAHEEKGSNMINKTSFIENCETSAVGRALGIMGIGIDTSIASANEVSDAIAKQGMIDKVQKTFDTEPPKDIMQLSIDYIKTQKDKKKAFTTIMKKYEQSLTEKQVEAIKKFVR